MKSNKQLGQDELVVKFPRLSETEYEYDTYGYCGTCNLGFLNDVSTLHPICPNCRLLMMNMSKDGVINSIKARSQEDFDKLPRVKIKEIAKP